MADKGKKKFTYQERDASTWKRKSQEGAGNFDDIWKEGTVKFKAQDGKNQVRVLPPTWDDADDFGYPILVHYGIGPEEQTYLCRKMLGDDEDCAICDEAASLAADGEIEDSKKFKARKRKGWWLLDRRGEEPEIPMVWAAPHGTHKDVLLACDGDDGEVLRCDHPEEGYDVHFTKEGAKKLTKYTGVRLGRDSKAILEDEDEMSKVLAFVTEHPLDSMLNFRENKYLMAVLAGGAPKSADDDEDEDAPKSKGKKRPRLDEDEGEDEPKPKGKKKPADDDEADDEDESPDFDEMDEAALAKFVKKHRLDVELDDDDSVKKRRRAVSEAWDEHLGKKKASDDEDEDEPKPKGKKKPVDDDDDEPTPTKTANDKLKAASARAKERAAGKKKASDDEDEDEPKPKGKKKPADDDDDE